MGLPGTRHPWQHEAYPVKMTDSDFIGKNDRLLIKALPYRSKCRSRQEEARSPNELDKVVAHPSERGVCD